MTGQVTRRSVLQLLGGGADQVEPLITAGKTSEAPVVRAANEVLRVIPLWERMTNNPILESTVAGWPSDDDPLYANSIYADNFTTNLLYDGKLEPA